MVTAGTGIYVDNELVGIATVDWEIDSIIDNVSQMKPFKKTFSMYKRGSKINNSFALYGNTDYDYIIAMDDSNIRNIQSIMGADVEHKIHRLLDFTNHPRNIRDPWYTGNFEECYQDIVDGCQAFLDFLKLRLIN